MPEESLYWYVTVTVAGAPVEPLLVRSALVRLTERHPFMSALRFTGRGAQLEYWDEGPQLGDVAKAATRVWSDHRSVIGLPDWQIVGLEVLERSVRRSTRSGVPLLAGSQELHPLGI